MDKAKLLIPTKDLQITYYIHFKSILLCTEKKRKKICQKRDKLYGKKKKKKKKEPCIQALLASDLIQYLCHKESRRLS